MIYFYLIILLILNFLFIYNTLTFKIKMEEN